MPETAFTLAKTYMNTVHQRIGYIEKIARTIEKTPTANEITSTLWCTTDKGRKRILYDTTLGESLLANLYEDTANDIDVMTAEWKNFIESTNLAQLLIVQNKKPKKDETKSPLKKQTGATTQNNRSTAKADIQHIVNYASKIIENEMGCITATFCTAQTCKVANDQTVTNRGFWSFVFRCFCEICNAYITLDEDAEGSPVLGDLFAIEHGTYTDWGIEGKLYLVTEDGKLVGKHTQVQGNNLTMALGPSTKQNETTNIDSSTTTQTLNRWKQQAKEKLEDNKTVTKIYFSIVRRAIDEIRASIRNDYLEIFNTETELQSQLWRLTKKEQTLGLWLKTNTSTKIDRGKTTKTTGTFVAAGVGVTLATGPVGWIIGALAICATITLCQGYRRARIKTQQMKIGDKALNEIMQTWVPYERLFAEYQIHSTLQLLRAHGADAAWIGKIDERKGELIDEMATELNNPNTVNTNSLEYELDNEYGSEYNTDYIMTLVKTSEDKGKNKK